MLPRNNEYKIDTIKSVLKIPNRSPEPVTPHQTVKPQSLNAEVTKVTNLKTPAKTPAKSPAPNTPCKSPGGKTTGGSPLPPKTPSTGFH